MICEQMAQLTAQLDNIRRRSADLTALKQLPLGEIRLQKLPKRYCCRIQEHVSLDGEVDFLIKRLQKEHENTLYIIGNNRIGALLDEEQWPKGVYNMYSAVFIIDETAVCGDSLAAGWYFSVFYRGTYTQTAKYLPQLLQYAAEQGWELAGQPLEIYHIDIHETSQREEFLTEVQLPVRRKEETV